MKNNNVVKVNFSKSKRVLPDLNLRAIKIKKVTMPKASTVKIMLVWLCIGVRWTIYLFLYWLRLPVTILCNIISIPMMLAWLFAWYAFPDKVSMVWGFGTISFLAFVISWAYDFVLMAISPQEIIRNL